MSCVSVAPTRIFVSQSEISSKFVLTRNWYGAFDVLVGPGWPETLLGFPWVVVCRTLGTPKMNPNTNEIANQPNAQSRLVNTLPCTAQPRPEDQEKKETIRNLPIITAIPVSNAMNNQ